MSTLGQMMQPQQVRQGDSEASIDAVNQWMRAQPWWRALAQSGPITPAKRQQILQMAQQNGVQVDMGDIEVDPSGNFNPKGHKLRNTLIGLGAGAGAIFGAPALAGLLGGAGGAGGAAAAGGGFGLGETGAVLGLGGSGLGGGAAAGSLGSMLLPGAIGSGTQLLGGYMGNRAANNSAQMQIEAANRAAELQSQSEAEQLAFQREQAAIAQKNWEEAQAKNYQLEQDRLARQEPFRRAGVGALGQLARPIPRSSGSLGSLLGR